MLGETFARRSGFWAGRDEQARRGGQVPPKSSGMQEMQMTATTEARIRRAGGAEAAIYGVAPWSAESTGLKTRHYKGGALQGSPRENLSGQAG